MSNERIDLTQDELRDKLYDWMTKGYEPQMAVSDDIPNEISEILFAIEHLGLIAELKRCYEELDSLPTRWQMSEIHNYTKWLETVESYFLADGSFNQDADFVRKCAVNNKYGYRIELIDGVETVVHESENQASE